jgi:hypothetical protein
MRTAHDRFSENTNLEEVSDWLTKIIIGLGLVEFDKLRGFLVDAADVVATSLAQPRGGEVMAVGAIVYGFVCGFLQIYIWSRIRLRRDLEDAHEEDEFDRAAASSERTGVGSPMRGVTAEPFRVEARRERPLDDELSAPALLAGRSFVQQQTGAPG